VTTVIDAGPFEKRVTLVVTDDQLDAAKGQAARKLGKDLKIPGFRPGRAPRQVVEATVGADRIRSEAIDTVLPEAVSRVLSEEEIVPAARPQVEKIEDIDNGVSVEVLVALWPALDEVPDYEGRKIEVESPDVDDEELESQIERLREQFASLETAEREATVGDYIVLDLSANQGGSLVEEASAGDLLYEVGSGLLLPELDDHATGSSAGSILSFDGALPPSFGDRAGQTVTYRVLVKEVKRKVLPELTDEWVDENTEHDTVDSLKGELETRLAQFKLGAVYENYQRRLLDTLITELTVEIPEAIVTGEMEDLLHRFVHQLEEQGISFEDYLKATGLSQEQLLADLRAQATRTVSTELVLDAVRDHEQLDVSEEEMEEALAAFATATEEDPAKVRETVLGSPREQLLRSDILRRKALNTLLEAADPIDDSGNTIDFDALAEELAESDVDGEEEEA